MVYIYCRYREISPVCLGKNRPLTQSEATKEHLIPKTLLRDPKIKARLGITFNPSQLPNIDISCKRCNNLKNDLADVPFAWKLQYFNKYKISLNSKRKLERTVNWASMDGKYKGLKEKILICLYKGNVKQITKEACVLEYQKIEVKLIGDVINEVIDRRHKLPRKLKKKLVNR
ncbi:MAG TPA: hypothetical protein VJ824_16865 [Bacillota bacterium]|nr:hypothetical protein [Bacillota bacterium]